MKRMIASAVCAFALAASAEEGVVQATIVTSEAPEKSLKVLMIGNSYSLQMVYSMPPIAKDMGLGLDICELYLPGCTFDRHWNNVEQPEKKPYHVYRNRYGVADKMTNGNIPDMLKSDKWDIVTIQQGSHKSWQPDTYQPYADKLIGLVKKLAPQAKILVHETWSYTPFDGRLAKWGLGADQMYSCLHAAYANLAAKHGFELIPTGTAVQEWRRRLPVRYAENTIGGDVCGGEKFEQDPATGKWKPAGDVFHLNHKGNHLQALVWTAKLFDVDVTPCAYVPSAKAKDGTPLVITAEEAKLMRAIAMDVVRPAAK